MARGFSGSKLASFIAGALFLLVAAAIILIMGGDDLMWWLRTMPTRLSRATETTFPTLWEYKVYILVFAAVIGVIFFVRKMHDGPVKRA